MASKRGNKSSADKPRRRSLSRRSPKISRFLRQSGLDSAWSDSESLSELDSGAISRPFDDVEDTPLKSALGTLRRNGARMKNAERYFFVLVRQLFFSAFIGIIAGLVGVAFQFAMRWASGFFLASEAAGASNGSFRALFLLPFGGLAIVALYKSTKLSVDAGTNQVVESLTADEKPSLWLVPSIFIGSVITQLFGGSAGREGAALQLGGGVGLGAGRLFRLKGNSLHIAILCGMSGGFAAVFGTPVTAAVLALEIACVGVVYYPAFLPSLISASIGAAFTSSMGFPPFSYNLPPFANVSIGLFLRAIALGLCSGLVCILFCSAIRRTTQSFIRRFPNDYWRVFFGGSCVVAATVILGTNAYNGTGLANIQAALDGKALPWDFALKILFTAITLGAGFKGGEIVPALAVGATFGCSFGPYLGLASSQGAALGMIAVFCGSTNCPLTALVLSIELFGAENTLVFAIVCGVSYMTSGRSGLYRSQKMLFSKLTANPFDVRLRKTLQKDLEALEAKRASDKGRLER